ncbi:hypothetical protein SDC9_133390 [bioreactor metagenome]|uniref:Uncharacterized protein n=1 Tax=bioreactor metagenome TaxID=1076179 RepID=A0A645DAI3_9ZZZZ
MFQHLLTLTVADPLVHFSVNAQLRLCNQLLIFAIFCFDVILNGVAVEAFRHRDGDAKVFEQYETEIFIRRAAHRMVQTRFRQGDPLNQRIAVNMPLVL